LKKEGQIKSLCNIAIKLIILAILCGSCVPIASTPEITTSSTNIAFQVLEQAAPLGDQPAAAAYTVITNSKDLDTIRTRIPTQAAATLQSDVNTATSLYLLAFAGVRGTSGYTLNITAIQQKGNQYTVVVSETIPDQETIVEPATTLPYIIVTIPLSELPQGEKITFIFTDPEGAFLEQADTQIP
jgi:hypothetical protein